MDKQYNQLRATLAVAKASFKAMLRNPSAVAFTLVFPLVIILVFGFIGGSPPSVTFALNRQSDSSNYIIQGLLRSKVAKLSYDVDTATIRKDLERGAIAAVLSIDSTQSPMGYPQYVIHTQTSSASGDKYPILKMALAQTMQGIESKIVPAQYRLLTLDELPPIPGRHYTIIDFILPGMLGFSLLGSAVFGVAFLFFNFRQQLVLKRYYATPIKKGNILFGEGLARVIFQLLTAVVLIVVGKYAFHFTLIHGWITFAELLVLSLLGVIVFMGFGFVISNVATSESTIPVLSNIVTLPQMLIGGTFFSTDAFPKWMQGFCDILPLKQLNDALRNVAFEGAHLTDCWKQMGALVLWGIAVYVVAIRFFKWE